MQRQMYNLEYRAALSEMKACEGRRLDKVYEIEPNLFRFDFGDTSFIVAIGQHFYATEHPPAAPQAPSAFAMYLRSQLNSQKLMSASQHKSDRIFIFAFQSNLLLVFEMFAGGNMFLIGEDGRIMRPYHFKQTERKKYRVGDKYIFPESKVFHIPPSPAEWKALPQDSALSSSLPKLPIGKPYVLEALSRAKISPERKPSDLSDTQVDIFLRTLADLMKNPSPCVFIDKASDAPAELSLCALAQFPSDKFTSRQFNSWGEAAQFFFTSAKHAEVSLAEKLESPALLRLKHRRAEQESALARADGEIALLEKKAKYVSENLALIDERISSINGGASCPSLGQNERLDLKKGKYYLKAVE